MYKESAYLSRVVSRQGTSHHTRNTKQTIYDPNSSGSAFTELLKKNKAKSNTNVFSLTRNNDSSTVMSCEVKEQAYTQTISLIN
jgi:hypothetical protein